LPELKKIAFNPLICLQALDLIGPLNGMTNSLSGVREEASILFAYGLLLMKQRDLQEARYVLVSQFVKGGFSLQV